MEPNRSHFILVFALLLCGIGVGTSFLISKLSPVMAGEETYPTAVVNEKAIDHAILDALLKAHVKDGWVDYASLKSKESELSRYLDSLADLKPEEHGRNEMLAMYINAYNAATLKLILEHYPEIKSIKDIPTNKRWKARRWRIASKTVSLDGIEHQILRKRFTEPRIHFAINCASIGCPPLRHEAYVARRLEEQLQTQAEYIHQHEKWVRFNQNGNEIHLTPLYKWFGSDFETASGSILQYAAQFSPELDNFLHQHAQTKIRWLDWDWSLNGN